MTTTTQPDTPLVIGLSVLYEDQPDGRVIAHIPRSWGESAAPTISARPGAAVLRDLIPGLPTLAQYART
ncbi:MAG TPA: hypothetical protein VFY45_18545 [Baekduia sp.]|nr:hypothetical protein [Baekduia sp.]